MFNLNDSMRYYLYPYPTDMRKSFIPSVALSKISWTRTSVMETYSFLLDEPAVI